MIYFVDEFKFSMLNTFSMAGEVFDIRVVPLESAEVINLFKEEDVVCVMEDSKAILAATILLGVDFKPTREIINIEFYDEEVSLMLISSSLGFENTEKVEFYHIIPFFNVEEEEEEN